MCVTHHKVWTIGRNGTVVFYSGVILRLSWQAWFVPMVSAVRLSWHTLSMMLIPTPTPLWPPDPFVAPHFFFSALVAYVKPHCLPIVSPPAEKISRRHPIVLSWFRYILSTCTVRSCTQKNPHFLQPRACSAPPHIVIWREDSISECHGENGPS